MTTTEPRTTTAGPVMVDLSRLWAHPGGDDWQDRGLCREVGGDLFFPEPYEPTRDARRICGACEVQAECLAYALARDERHGIWGGTDPEERRKMLGNRKWR